MKNKNGYVKIINNVFSFNDVKIGIMIRKMLVFLGLMLCFVSVVRADEKKVELIPVYEKTFEDTIVDVIFDTASVTIEEAKSMGWKEEGFSEMEKKQNKCEILYPKVVILKKGKKKIIRFYEYNGKLKKTYESGDYAEVVISQNEKYIGVTTPTKIFEKEGYLTKFEMIDDNGNILWKIEGLGVGPYVPSPDGRLCIGTPSVEVENAPIEIFGKNGLVKKIENPYGGWSGAFSNDGKYIAIAIRQSILWQEPAKGYLMLLDNNGGIIWERNDVGIISDISFSPKNNWIIFKCGSDTIRILTVFTIKGVKIFEIPGSMGSQSYFFSSKENEVAIINGQGYFWLVNLLNKKIITKLERKKERFRYISADKNFEKFVVGVYPNKIYIVNRKGNILLEKEFSNIGFHGTPKMNLTDNFVKIAFSDEKDRIRIFIIKKIY
uniref:WD40 repeat domain-containing protein n=1 Tax=candidate division WOR-3 bacterium TaxID=2052148 RepID=A0A7C4U9C2_UNCW3